MGRSIALSGVSPDPAAVRVFPLFVALYVTGFMIDVVDDWHSLSWTGASVVLSIVTIVLAKRRIVFLAFLILTTAYFLLVRFPDVANHVNLLIFCNILLILGLAYSYFSRMGRENFSAYFEALLSPVRLMLIVTFAVAGFHKFNYDFLNPEVSCIRTFLGTFRWALTAPLFNESLIYPIPLIVILCIIGVLVALLVLPHRTGGLPRLLLLGGLALIVSAISFATVLQPLADHHVSLLVLGLAGLIVFWQLVEGPLLLVSRCQAFFLCLALVFHAYLGIVGFVAFPSFAFALLLTFVPKPVLEAWNQERCFRLGSLGFDRVYAYVGLNLLAGLLTGIHLYVTPLFDPSNISAMKGILFNGGVLILIWPLLFALLRGKRGWRWRGVSVFDSRTPKFLYLLPLLLLLFGMTSHFGLRTAGNFSMYSNLRTEGATSNHILLGRNPLKIWGYQEDTVRVLEFDDPVGHGGSHLGGEEFPIVEFRKLVSKWTGKAEKIRIVFEYQGRIYSSDNIVADRTWRPARWDWEMVLLDFREIQPEGPNRCRW